MRPDTLDLRERIVAEVDRHEGSLRWIARVFGEPIEAIFSE